jgi:5-methylcytosine-specific restriction enzyme A
MHDRGIVLMALTYPPRRKLSSSQREALYDRCCEVNGLPICNIPWCGQPVLTTQRWVESHYPVPHALGGQETGIAHERCNRLFASEVEVPIIAHVKRVRRRHIGAFVSRNPLPCGRGSKFKKTMSGKVVLRGKD